MPSATSDLFLDPTHMLVSAAMKTSRLLIIVVATCLILACGVSAVQLASFPARLNDQDFWSLSQKSSEEDGVFRSDNLLSNETSFQYIIPNVLKSNKEGRVYLGVGPEQNFTYTAAVKPAMAVIIDIRHGNLDV